jgi:hypothetical protein
MERTSAIGAAARQHDRETQNADDREVHADRGYRTSRTEPGSRGLNAILTSIAHIDADESASIGA